MVYTNVDLSFCDYNGKRLINLFPWVIISDYDPINNTEIVNLNNLTSFSFPDIIVWKGKEDKIESILNEREVHHIVEDVEDIKIYLLRDSVSKHFSNEEIFDMFEIL